jgi:hypothetical protein
MMTSAFSIDLHRTKFARRMQRPVCDGRMGKQKDLGTGHDRTFADICPRLGNEKPAAMIRDAHLLQPGALRAFAKLAQREPTKRSSRRSPGD